MTMKETSIHYSDWKIIPESSSLVDYFLKLSLHLCSSLFGVFSLCDETHKLQKAHPPSFLLFHPGVLLDMKGGVCTTLTQ